MNIIEAIKDPNLFRPFLEDKDGSIKSWRTWMTVLRALYGLPISPKRHDLLRQLTGRDPDLLPDEGFDLAVLLCGRRSGKSRISSVIGAYEAILSGNEFKCQRGEKPLVGIFSPTRRQSQNVKNYLRAIFKTDLLKNEVVSETREGFELRNGNMIEILAGDYRTVRGFTLIAAIVDEAAFFGVEDDTRVKSDQELLNAILPSLASTQGRCTVLTTPYSRAGWCWNTYQKHYGNDRGSTLVVNGPSRLLNETLPQRIIDRAMQEDLARAKAEYHAEFRDSLSAFVPREVVEALVQRGRLELLPQTDTRYFAFVDLSSGTPGGDDAALAIAHRKGRTVVIDLLRQYKPPFNPYHVVGQMAEDVKRFNVRVVTGDHWSPGFVKGAFQGHGLNYLAAEEPKAVLYANLLPRLCSGEIELPDNTVLVDQLASLERRTRSGGRDIIDHPATQGARDDVCNALAGAANLAGTRSIVVGGAW